MSRRMAAFRWVLLLLALYLMENPTTAAPVDSSQEINDFTSGVENVSEKLDQSLIHENEDSKEDTPTKNEEQTNTSDNEDEELSNDSTHAVEDDNIESHETIDTKEHTDISSGAASHEDLDEEESVISEEKDSNKDEIKPNNNTNPSSTETENGKSENVDTVIENEDEERPSSKETENVNADIRTENVDEKRPSSKETENVNADISTENVDEKSHEEGTSKELDTSTETEDKPVKPVPQDGLLGKSSTESTENSVEDNSNTEALDSEVLSVNDNNMENTEHMGKLLSSSKDENSDENHDNPSFEVHEEIEEEPSVSSENTDVGKSHENIEEAASQQETHEEHGSEHDATQNGKDTADIQTETQNLSKENHDVNIDAIQDVSVDTEEESNSKENKENPDISQSAHLEMSKDLNWEQDSANESEDHEDVHENKSDDASHELINEESGEQGRKEASNGDYEDEDENSDLNTSSAKHIEDIHISGKESHFDTEESTEDSKKSEESAASHENVEDAAKSTDEKSTEEESEEVTPSPQNSSASNENNLEETSHEDHDKDTSLLNKSDEETTESSTEDHDVPAAIHSASEEKSNENDSEDDEVHATSKENAEDSDNHSSPDEVPAKPEENDSGSHSSLDLVHAPSEENTKENDSNDHISPDEEDKKENHSSEEDTKENDSNISQENHETPLEEKHEQIYNHKEESDVSNKVTSLETSESNDDGSAEGSDEIPNSETASQDIKHNSKSDSNDDTEHQSKKIWSESDEDSDIFDSSKVFNITYNFWDDSSENESDETQKEGSGNGDEITPIQEEHIIPQRVQHVGAVPGGENSEETTDCPLGDDCSNSSALPFDVSSVTGVPGLGEDDNVTDEIIPVVPNLENNNDTTVPILAKGSGRKQLEAGSINEPGVDSRSEESETAEGSTGSYVVLGVIMATIVVLLGYSILKSRRRNASESKNEDFGTEMIDVKKTLLPGNEHNGTIHPKGHSGDDSNSKLLPHPDYKGDNEEGDDIEKIEPINGLHDKNDLNRQQSIDFDSIESQLEPTTNPFKSQPQEENDAFPEVVIQKERVPIIAQSARDRFFSTNPFKQNASENTNGLNNMPEVVIEKTPTYNPVYNGYANGNTNGLASGSQDQISIPSSPTTKVKVVATVDEDSILKKPIIINRDQNGVTY